MFHWIFIRDSLGFVFVGRQHPGARTVGNAKCPPQQESSSCIVNCATGRVQVVAATLDGQALNISLHQQMPVALTNCASAA